MIRQSYMVRVEPRYMSANIIEMEIQARVGDKVSTTMVLIEGSIFDSIFDMSFRNLKESIRGLILEGKDGEAS